MRGSLASAPMNTAPGSRFQFPSPPDNEAPSEQLTLHDVLNLLHKRYHTCSTPIFCSSDYTVKLFLFIKGVGMCDAVFGVMTAAVACLGVSDAFGTMCESLAGRAIRSYSVSRQSYQDTGQYHVPRAGHAAAEFLGAKQIQTFLKKIRGDYSPRAKSETNEDQGRFSTTVTALQVGIKVMAEFYFENEEAF